MARDWRDDRIDQLEALVHAQQATIEAQQATIEAQQATIEAQQRTIARLEARVRELEAQVARHSGNSSRPPSSDPPGAPPPALPRRTGKRRGGQPGHLRYERPLVPPEEISRTRVLVPAQCRRCGGPLVGDDPQPYRHQVIDIPKVKATVDEYQLCSLLCEHCGIRTRAALPAGVPSGHFGPRLQAMVSVCSGDYRMSKREIERLVEDFFELPIALGSISNLEQGTREAIAAPVEQIAQAIRQEPVVHAGETSWSEGGRRAWLWVAVTRTMALFLIRAHRNAVVAKELLGERATWVLCSDRWSAYEWVSVVRRQLCWAHLLRHFRGFQALGPEGAEIGLALELLTETMFHIWHRARDGTLSRADFQRLMTRLSAHVVAWLHKGQACSSRKVAGTCREILTLEPALWTFVREEGVEPTNHHGERILRHGVLWRKRSFGTDSPSGSRFVDHVLTVVSTLRLQKRNVLDDIAAACQAALENKPAPSLLPA